MNKSSLGTYFAALLNVTSSLFLYFFVADILFKVDKKDAICIFALMFINLISKMIVINSVKGVPK